MFILKRKIKISLISALLILPGYSRAAHWFASVSGSNTGTGSISYSWDLQTALNQPLNLKAGDTLWLRGGTYTGNFTSNLKGDSGKYITVMPYTGERAIIEDNRQFASGATLQINGAWTLYKDLEITNANANRNSNNASSFRPMGLQIDAPHTRCINLIIHDVGHGIGFWKGATDAEIYGCLIYNCGIANKPGVYATHGHGIYTQNNSGIKTIENNIIFNQFGFGIHSYPNPGNVNGYVIKGNTLFHNGILTHDTIRYNNIIVNPYTGYTSESILIAENHTYDAKDKYNYKALIEADFYLGATDVNCKNLKIENNYFAGKGRAGLAVLNWDSVIFKNNTIYYLQNGTLGFALQSGGNNMAHSWDSNHYYGGNNAKQFSYNYGVSQNFPDWKTMTGFDGNSKFELKKPSGNQLFLQPNKYEKGRAHLIIYNWDSAKNISIDLSGSGLANGQKYKIVNLQDYFGQALYTGTYQSSQPVISIQVNNSIPAKPTGWASPAGTSIEFLTLEIIPELPSASIEKLGPYECPLSVFPNPSADLFHIRSLNHEPISNYSFQIYDYSAQFIEAPKMQIYKEEAVLNLKHLPKGLYYLKYATPTYTGFKALMIY